MRPLSTALLALLLASTVVSTATAQLRLVNRLSAPLLLVSGEAPRAGERSAARLLADDPSVRALLDSFGIRPDAARSGQGTPIDQLRTLIEMSSGEFELAICEIFSAEDALPGMVCRLGLTEAQAAALRGALERGTLTRPLRLLGKNQTHVMRSADPDSEELFEVALVGRDLLIGNQAASFAEVLLSSNTTSSVDVHPPMAADPGFRSLYQRVSAEPGSVVVSLSWDRLADDLEMRLARSKVDRAHLPILHALGVMCAERVVIGVESGPAGLEATVLLDQPDGPCGVFRAAQEEPIRKLVDKLPTTGSGGMVVAIDDAKLPAVAKPGADSPSPRIGIGIRGGFAAFGVGFDRSVLPKLGGAVSMHLLPGAASANTEAGSNEECLRAVMSVPVRNRRDANALFGSLTSCLAGTVDRSSPAAELVVDEVTERQTLRLRERPGGSIGVVDSAIVYAPDAAAIEQLAALESSKSRKRTRGIRQRAQKHLKAQNLDRAVGVFRIAVQDVEHFGAVCLEDDGLIRIQVVTPS